jgi:lipoyl-dependent peroxiredoxin
MAGPDSVVYTAEATCKGGRNGVARLAEGGLAVAMATPKEMGGSGEGSNPEQMFALGYAACFNGAVLAVGGQKKYDVSRAVVNVKVGIGRDATSYALKVDIALKIPGLEDAQVKEVLDAAHEICPYSKATRGNVPVTLTVL